MRKVVKALRKCTSEILRYMPIKESVSTSALYGELLKDRTALITGGTRGIGFSIADSFIKNGACVIITGRDRRKIDMAVEKLKFQNDSALIYGLELDNTRIKEMNEKFNNILKEINNRKIDILVNNAGIINKTQFWDSTEEDFDNVINTNLKGTYFITKIVAKYMLENKGKYFKHIFFIINKTSSNFVSVDKMGNKSIYKRISKRIKS